LEEAGLNHTYRDVLHICELKIINYLVLRYPNTGAPPFEEWAEKWLHSGQVQSSCTKEKAFGEGLIWGALA
jgi:hypothetical protein